MSTIAVLRVLQGFAADLSPASRRRRFAQQLVDIIGAHAPRHHRQPLVGLQLLPALFTHAPETMATMATAKAPSGIIRVHANPYALPLLLTALDCRVSRRVSVMA